VVAVSLVFGSGGIDALDNAGFAQDDAMIAAFKASGARLACLCGSNEAYAREAGAAAKALRAAGGRGLYLAGEPGEREVELRAAGVEAFIHAGSDAIMFLQGAYRRLE
jgi:methylmalonyl-CoA mutase